MTNSDDRAASEMNFEPLCLETWVELMAGPDHHCCCCRNGDDLPKEREINSKIYLHDLESSTHCVFTAYMYVLFFCQHSTETIHLGSRKLSCAVFTITG